MPINTGQNFPLYSGYSLDLLALGECLAASDDGGANGAHERSECKVPANYDLCLEGEYGERC